LQLKVVFRGLGGGSSPSFVVVVVVVVGVFVLRSGILRSAVLRSAVRNGALNGGCSIDDFVFFFLLLLEFESFFFEFVVAFAFEQGCFVIFFGNYYRCRLRFAVSLDLSPHGRCGHQR